MSFFDKAKAAADNLTSSAKKAARPKRNYRLTYFDIRGLAETTRLVFAVGDEPYVDNRIPFTMKPDGSFDRPEFDKIKESLPFKQVPVLDFDEKGKNIQIAQSRSIERFLARTFDLYGANDIEHADIDTFTDEINDLRAQYWQAKGKDTLAKELKHTYAAGESNEEKWAASLPDNILLLERWAVAHGANDWLIGGKISLADIQLYSWLFAVPPDALARALEKSPTIAKIYKNVSEHPNVVAWVAKRPQTAF